MAFFLLTFREFGMMLRFAEVNQGVRIEGEGWVKSCGLINTSRAPEIWRRISWLRQE